MSLLDSVKRIVRKTEGPKPNEEKEAGVFSAGDFSGLEGYFSGVSFAGKTITAETLLQMTATWSAVRLISETIGTLPVHLYERIDGGRQKARDHDLYGLVHDRPNPHTSSAEFFESVAVSLCCRGHAYLYNSFFNNRVVNSTVLDKTLVKPRKLDNGNIEFEVKIDGRVERHAFDSGVITSIKGFGGPNNLEGYPPFHYCKNALGLALAAEEYGSNFFKSGARPTGVLMYDGSLKEEQRTRMRDEFNKVLGSGGDSNAQLAVLEAHMQYQAISTSNNDSQFIETRKHQIAEVARIFRVPPSMLMDSENDTYHNNEQSSVNFSKYTLRSYLIRIEQALNYSLLQPDEQKKYYFEFDIQGLLRGSTAERGAWYTSMRNVSAMTPNEVRKLENLPPIDGGDDLYVPLNMAPVRTHEEILTGDKDGES